MAKTFKNWFLVKIRSLFCVHDFRVLYLDNRFYAGKEFATHSWICQCSKCGKIRRVASKMAEL